MGGRLRLTALALVLVAAAVVGCLLVGDTRRADISGQTFVVDAAEPTTSGSASACSLARTLRVRIAAQRPDLAVVLRQRLTNQLAAAEQQCSG